MLISSFILLLCNIGVIYAAGGGYGVDWDYKVNGVHGPQNWKTTYGLCGLKSQSPVNILTKEVKFNKDLSGLTLGNYDQIGDDVFFAMANTKNSIGFPAKSQNKTIPQTVTFNGTKYRFYQFHFHWGVKNYQGSEHLVDWQQYAAEVHFIHYNTKYADVTKAIDKPDGLLVWGHFLKVNSRTAASNPHFEKLLGYFSKAETCCATTDVELNLFKLLPDSHDKFYTYKGSLTTPPCYESVRWIVNPDPIFVSERQMNLFRELKDAAMGGIMIKDNYRPPEPLYSRVVESNFDVNAEGAGVSITPCFLSIVAAILAMVFTF